MNKVFNLFLNCFKSDEYYNELTKEKNNLSLNQFKSQINYCLSQPYSYGLFDKDNTLIAFILNADLDTIIQDNKYEFIFGSEDINNIELNTLKDKLKNIIGKNYLYIILIAVGDNYRNKGYASLLLKNTLNSNLNKGMFADISNKNLTNLFLSNQFKIEPITSNYLFAIKNK